MIALLCATCVNTMCCLRVLSSVSFFLRLKTTVYGVLTYLCLQIKGNHADADTIRPAPCYETCF